MYINTCGGIFLKKNRLVFVLIILGSFLLLSAVNASDIALDDANSQDVLIEGHFEESFESIENNQDTIYYSDDFKDADFSDEGDQETDSNDNVPETDSPGEDNVNDDSSSDDVADGSADSNDFSLSVSTGSNSTTNPSNSANATSSVVSLYKIPYKIVAGKNVVSTYGKRVRFSIKVLNVKGKPIYKSSVIFLVAGKTYKRYTNKKGVASINLNYEAGKYTIKYFTSKRSGKYTYTVKNFYKITTYKWKSGANVLKNKKIKANVPKSALVKKVIKAAKYGTPVVMFKGGKGKAVFITAGVHGNELPSQVAAMKLIKYLQNHPIKGTVYLMPFMNPKGTAANVRDYKGYHLNKNANKKGSISYKTVKLITKFKCSAYGDFHSTRPRGKPGTDVALGTYLPTKESATLAKYISKNAKVKYLIYKKAGVEYPGAIEDVVSTKGIPAVTCEVISPHGKIWSGADSKSFTMMKVLLKYNSII